MSDNKKKKELKELVILTPEQIEELPVTVKDNVVFLTEKVGSTDLMKLNPMVTELIAIRNEGKAIAFIEADAEGKFDKANIQEFVDIKKRVRTFRARVKEVGKEMKMEPTKINKAIISIEKIFLAEATDVYDNSEKLFEPYIKAEKEKELLKQKKKDQALLDKIEEAKKGEDKATLQLDKTNVYNKIKYELITGLITEVVADAVVNGSEHRVKEVKFTIDTYTYELITTGADDSILDEAVIGELKHFYVNAKQKGLGMLQAKLEAFTMERQNVILESQKTPFPAPPVIATENAPIGQVAIQNDKEFGDYIVAEGKRLLSLTSNRLNEASYCTPNIYHLRTILYQFNDL